MIIGLAGAIGSGKSFTQLKQALQYAEERHKQIVFNFEINLKELYRYANMPKEYDSYLSTFIYELGNLITYILYILKFKIQYPVKKKSRLPWIAYLCTHGGIIQMPNPEELEALLIPESVVCLDEAGILLNSREFAKTSKQLLADLAQSRKDGCDLFWAAQFEEQVDKQLRLLTQYWIHCDSLAVYDKELRRPKLFWKRVYWFRAADYFRYLHNPMDYGSHFKARFAYAFMYEGGLLSPSDKQLFNVFNSFSRLDIKYLKISPPIKTLHRCDFPKDYYLDKLNIYAPQLDPMSRHYQLLYGFYRNKEKFDTNVVAMSSSVPSRSGLIRQALSVARSKGVTAPYLKDMDDKEILKFIRANA